MRRRILGLTALLVFVFAFAFSLSATTPPATAAGCENCGPLWCECQGEWWMGRVYSGQCMIDVCTICNIPPSQGGCL